MPDAFLLRPWLRHLALVCCCRLTFVVEVIALNILALLAVGLDDLIEVSYLYIRCFVHLFVLDTPFFRAMK